MRCRSILLLGLFLLGSLGVPLTDGVLYHLAGRDPCAEITHFETQGSAHHADRCALAQPTGAQREALGSAQVVRSVLQAIVGAVAPSNAVPHSVARVTLQHSRAPPA